MPHDSLFLHPLAPPPPCLSPTKSGYTGYIPSSASITVPIKSHTEHIGKDAGVATARRLAADRTAEQVTQSLYSTHNKSLGPGTYTVPKRRGGEGGGYWIADGADARAVNKTFIAGTTYRQEVCETQKKPGEVAMASPRGLKASIFPTHTTLEAMKTARHEVRGRRPLTPPRLMTVSTPPPS